MCFRIAVWLARSSPNTTSGCAAISSTDWLVETRIAGSVERGPADVAGDGLLDARTAQAPAYMGGSPEMSVVDR
jgi:hypothetical protein